MQSAKLTVYLGSLFLIVLLLVCLLAASVPESTIKVSKASRMQLSRIVPEGWAFFTRDPKGPEIILYQQTSGGTWKRFVQRPSTPRYLFGINRKARAINQEFGRMLEDLPADSTWQEISGPIEQQSLWADSLPVTKIPNASLYPMLEGVYVLQKIEPVPWAWARSSNIQAYVKSKICKIHVVKSKRLAE